MTQSNPKPVESAREAAYLRWLTDGKPILTSPAKSAFEAGWEAALSAAAAPDKLCAKTGREHRWGVTSVVHCRDCDARDEGSAPARDGVPLDARKWLFAGGGGHEDGEDGLRAMLCTDEGLVDFLEAYRDDLLAAAKEQADGQ